MQGMPGSHSQQCSGTELGLPRARKALPTRHFLCPVLWGECKGRGWTGVFAGMRGALHLGSSSLTEDIGPPFKELRRIH